MSFLSCQNNIFYPISTLPSFVLLELDGHNTYFCLAICKACLRERICCSLWLQGCHIFCRNLRRLIFSPHYPAGNSLSFPAAGRHPEDVQLTKHLWRWDLLLHSSRPNWMFYLVSSKGNISQWNIEYLMLQLQLSCVLTVLTRCKLDQNANQKLCVGTHRAVPICTRWRLDVCSLVYFFCCTSDRLGVLFLFPPHQVLLWGGVNRSRRCLCRLIRAQRALFCSGRLPKRSILPSPPLFSSPVPNKGSGSMWTTTSAPTGAKYWFQVCTR